MLNKTFLLLIAGIFLVATISFATPYEAPTYNDINFSLCSEYTAPTYDSINFSLATSESCAAADTCTYSGSGTWEVNCADNCSITSAVDLGGEDLTIIGHGTFSTTADISNVGDILIAGDSSSLRCEVSCNGGCFT